MAKQLWNPSDERVARANLTAFRTWVEQHGGPSLPGYAELYDWSIRHAPDFWRAVWGFCGVRAERQGDEVVRHFDRMPGAQWFPQARLNFAQNLLRHQGDREALVLEGERPPTRSDLLRIA